MKKGEHVWRCEYCGKASKWGKSWRWFYGVYSALYRNQKGLYLPLVGCTSEHADKALETIVKEDRNRGEPFYE